MPRGSSLLLSLFALLTGCYATHGRADHDARRADAAPGSLDGAVPRRDGSWRSPGMDGGAPLLDASPSFTDGGGWAPVPDADVILPEVPDAGFPPGSVMDGYHRFCMSLAAVFCPAHVRCCHDEERRFPTEEVCLSELQRSCHDSAMRAGEFETRIVWDSAAADRILRDISLRGRTCASIGTWKLGSFAEGTIPEGGDCTPSSIGPGQPWASHACAGDLRCLITETVDGFEGVCAPRGPLGAACQHGSFDCEAGQFCALRGGAFSSFGACELPRDLGEECRGDRYCASGRCEDFRCVRPPPTRSNWCLVQGFG